MKYGMYLFVALVVLGTGATAGAQTASDYWNVNLRFESIRTDMQRLMDSGEGASNIQQQQIILSAADLFRVRTRSAMVYLQMLTYVTAPANIKDARLDLATVFDEEIPTSKRLASGFAAMAKKPYGSKTQSIAARMSEAISEMTKIDESLSARLKNTAVNYDWIGQ